ncbi:hypothetical protein HDU76_003360 [Blyttiomyces sp. JEL0837]|nr:hypothetical protein HDU76_003360 [Blyttiomyces sp. JEL0837]
MSVPGAAWNFVAGDGSTNIAPAAEGSSAATVMVEPAGMEMSTLNWQIGQHPIGASFPLSEPASGYNTSLDLFHNTEVKTEHTIVGGQDLDQAAMSASEAAAAAAVALVAEELRKAMESEANAAITNANGNGNDFESVDDGDGGNSASVSVRSPTPGKRRRKMRRKESSTELEESVEQSPDGAGRGPVGTFKKGKCTNPDDPEHGARWLSLRCNTTPLPNEYEEGQEPDPNDPEQQYEYPNEDEHENQNEHDQQDQDASQTSYNDLGTSMWGLLADTTGGFSSFTEHLQSAFSREDFGAHGHGHGHVGEHGGGGDGHGGGGRGGEVVST